MASITKKKNGYYAEVYVKGRRASKMFPQKWQAVEWSSKKQLELQAFQSHYNHKITTFEGLCDWYAAKVSANKKGRRWEEIRLRQFTQHPILKGKSLHKINRTLMAEWRDSRLQEVSAGSVLREMNLMTNVFKKAVVEWGAMIANPLDGLSRPKRPPPRTKLVSDDEIATLLNTMKWQEGAAKNIRDEISIAVLFALSTAMRAGEIIGFKKEDVVGNVLTLKDSKTGKGREIPLSKKALKLLSYLPNGEFTISSASLDSNFRKYRNRAGLEFTFHDLRHRAITDFAHKGIEVLALARIVGHSDPKQLLEYYNPSAQTLASMLD